jgi:hypothetical protein
VLDIPGHSPGHVVYLVREMTPLVVLGGDVWSGATIPTAYTSGKLAGTVMPDWWSTCCLQPYAGPELDARRSRRPANQSLVRVRKIAGQHATTGTERRHAVRMQEVDRDEVHLEHVSGLGPFDVDGSCHRMRAGPSLLDGGFDGAHRLGDVGVAHTGELQSLEPARDHRFEAHTIAGGHAQRRFHARVVVPPVDVLRRKRQVVRATRALCGCDGRACAHDAGGHHTACHVSSGDRISEQIVASPTFTT